MLGLMQQQPLLVSWLLSHAARHHGGAEVVSATGSGALHHATWAETERRARQLVRVLQRLGLTAQHRVGTLAWNDYRHLEVYYAASGMQAICHTINPALHRMTSPTSSTTRATARYSSIPASRL
jgi:acyl-CoA synthetase (AMP-forming)/AMP-acid ligase II